MAYEDHETRVGAHRILSIVLVPSSVCPRPRIAASVSNKAPDIQRMLSRTVSVFSSSAALFEKLKKGEYSSQENISEDRKDKLIDNEDSKINNPSMLNRLKSTYSRAYSAKSYPSPVIADGKAMNNSAKEQVYLNLLVIQEFLFMKMHSVAVLTVSELTILSSFGTTEGNISEVEQSSDYPSAFINLGTIPFSSKYT